MKLFGTDGIRGKANTELTPELAFSLGRAVATVFAEADAGQNFFLVGRDTRISGPMLSAALASGYMSAGAEVWDVGVLPTPALAYLTMVSGARAGAVISASHNPAIDNGIKFFSGDGYKLSDEVEMQVEQALDNPALMRRVEGDAVGILHCREELQELYVQYLFEAASLNAGAIKVVLDCANGAAYRLAPPLLRRLGCEVEVLSDHPDGTNINVLCGSTHMNPLRKRVVERGADLGLALDGDADRLLACDSRGQIIDGDSMLAIYGSYLKSKKRLTNNIVVGTIMSNLGLDAALRCKDIELVRSKVGDKYVLQEMQRHGAILGAEQSGHCIFLEHGTTGDGLLSAVMLLRVMVDEGKSLHELGSQLHRFPQVLTSVHVADRESALTPKVVKEAMSRVEEMLGGAGRLVVRPSGTEDVVRVMVEALDLNLAEEAVSIVVAALKTTSA